MKKLILAVLAVFLLPTISLAQDTPAADVALDYSPLYILKGYTIWMNGGSGSVAVNVNHWLGVAGDFGGYVGHIPQSFSGATYTFGPRFSYRKLDDRIAPFSEALFGGSHFSTSTGGITGGGNEFTFALGGGADIGLGSSRKFALRLGADYFGIRSSGSTTPSLRLSAGIVYRIGKR
jgi:hypothetical protein